MILTFVLGLFIVSFLLVLGKKTKLSAFVLFLGILITAALGSGPVTEQTLALLQTYPSLQNPQWKSANLIIVLGSGQSRWSKDFISPQVFGETRVMEAAKLYLSCKKSQGSCTVLTSGGDPGSSGEAEAVTMKRSLGALGVSEADILTEAESKDTYENARNSAKLMEGKHFDSVFLVTSGFHIKRAEICFQLNGVSVAAAPADHLQAGMSVLPGAGNLYYNNLVAHEYAGMLKAYFIKLTGINL